MQCKVSLQLCQLGKAVACPYAVHNLEPDDFTQHHCPLGGRQPLDGLGVAACAVFGVRFEFLSLHDCGASFWINESQKPSCKPKCNCTHFRSITFSWTLRSPVSLTVIILLTPTALRGLLSLAWSHLLKFTLTPNFPRPRFCLFLKFGQAIVIRVLMLNLWNFLC